MTDTVCDHVVAILTEWGADTVFGLAGDGINGFVESLIDRLTGRREEAKHKEEEEKEKAD